MMIIGSYRGAIRSECRWYHFSVLEGGCQDRGERKRDGMAGMVANKNKRLVSMLAMIPWELTLIWYEANKTR